MSIRYKLILSILVAFVGNIILVIGYYDLKLSKEIVGDINNEQAILNDKIHCFIDNFKNGQDINSLIEELEKKDNLFISLGNANGELVYKSKEFSEEGLSQQVSAIIDINNKSYLIRIVKPSNMKDLLVVKPMVKLVKAEFFIITFILIILTLIIYLNLVRPIEGLQNIMSKYKIGIKPTKIKRKDEIGWLHNCFIELTDDIDKERDKENRIIASISHDIKTPLTSVMGFAERLQGNKIEDERRKKYLKIIYSKAEDIKDIIEEFDEYLDYNLQRTINKKNIELGRFCEIIKEDYIDELTDMGIDFRIQCENSNEILNIDIAKIRRVFGNIINNSIKHKDKERLNIRISAHKINDYILFKTEDNGSGVLEENLNKIFEPLYTSDKSRKVAGLGLSICKNIVKYHNGYIWAENNENGLTISFTIK